MGRPWAWIGEHRDLCVRQGDQCFEDALRAERLGNSSSAEGWLRQAVDWEKQRLELDQLGRTK